MISRKMSMPNIHLSMPNLDYNLIWSPLPPIASLLNTPLTRMQKICIQDYTGNGSIPINQALRGNHPSPAGFETHADEINAAISRVKGDRIVKLYRGTLDRDPMVGREGEVVESKGFLSTTMYSKVTDSFIPHYPEKFDQTGEPVKAVIFGKRCLNIENLAHEVHEREVIFRSGSKFKIKFKHKDPKTRLTKIVFEEVDELDEIKQNQETAIRDSAMNKASSLVDRIILSHTKEISTPAQKIARSDKTALHFFTKHKETFRAENFNKSSFLAMVAELGIAETRGTLCLQQGFRIKQLYLLATANGRYMLGSLIRFLHLSGNNETALQLQSLLLKTAKHYKVPENKMQVVAKALDKHIFLAT